ncbi:MAG: DALR anticodon-binding domain-containing protein, partial [Janthinobacterium lividum]
EKVDIGYLLIPCERELYKVWEKAKESIKNQSKDFLTSLNELLRLLAPIEEFFNRVMVKDNNQRIANNRLALLSRIKKLFEEVCRFDLL